MNTEIKIEQKLHQLNSINTQINSFINHPKPSKALTNIIEELRTCLVKFTEAMESQSLESSLKSRFAEVLTWIHINLDKTTSLNPMLAPVITQISSLTNTLFPIYDVDSTTCQAKILSPHSKIGLAMALFFDLNADDHNAVIGSEVHECLLNEIPCITTRSMITGKNIRASADSWNIKIVLENLLLKTHDNWEIYELKPEYGGEFLVFLPRTLLKTGTQDDALRKMDLNPDTLRKIPLLGVFQTQERQNQFEGFSHIFVDTPTVSKVFYISGHGDKDSPAGLSAKDFLLFLEFLKSQRCKFLTVFSCRAGGTTSLLTLKHQKDSSLKNLSSRSFPILVKSIGDVNIFSGQPADKELKAYFEQLAAFIDQKKKPFSLFYLKKVIETVEKEKSKKWTNYIKGFFPTSAGVPMGFRPLGEHNKGYSLTILDLKKAAIENPRGQIHIKNHEFVCLHPVVTTLPIIFEEKDAALLSMIPGNGYHILDTLELGELTPLNYLNRVLEYQDEAKNGIIKGFFITELKGKKDTFKEVVCLNSPEHAYFTYKQGSDYYINDTPPKKISSFLHAILKLEAQIYSTPSHEAILASSAGYETLPSTDLNLFGSGDPALKELHALMMSLGNDSAETRFQKLVKYLEKMSLSPDDIQILVGLLLRNNFTDLAFELFKREKLDVNMQDYHGVPILIKAISAKHVPFVEYLLQNKANVNVQDKWGESPIHVAVSVNHPDILKLILSEPTLQLDVETENGYSPISSAVSQGRDEAYQRLVEKGAKQLLFQAAKDGMTPLARAVRNKNLRAIGFFLQEKADPNAGSPSPMMWAVKTNQWDILKKFVEAGGDLFRKDANGDIPLVDVLGRGSPEIIKDLLQDKSGDMFAKTGYGISPLAAAFHSGNLQIIRLVAHNNTQNPTKLAGDEHSLFENCVKKICELQDYDSLKQILQCFPKGFGSLEQIAVQQLLTKNNPRPDIIKSWLQEDVLHLVSPDSDYTNTMYHELLSSISHLGSDQLQKPSYRNLLKMLSQYNESDKAAYGLTQFVRTSSPPHAAVKIFLEETVDFMQLKDPILFLYEIINKGDRELIKLAISKGASLNSSSLFLEAAAKKEAPLFRWLVDKGADMNLYFWRLIDDQNHELIDFCLEKGVQLNPNDNKIENPLIRAAMLTPKDQGALFKKFTELGADMNKVVASRDKFATPFAALAQYGSYELIQWALDKGAQGNPSCPSHCITPTEAAAFNDWDKEKKALKLLFAQGGKFNNKVVRYRSPLVNVIRMRDVELVKLCLERGCDINDDSGYINPLQAAADIVDKIPEIFTLLIKTGVDVNKYVKHSLPAIILLLEKGSLELVQLGFKSGMSIASCEPQAIQAAVASNNRDIFHLVVNLPMPKPIKEYFQEADSCLNRIWEHVVKNNSVEIAKILLELVSTRLQKILP